MTISHNDNDGNVDKNHCVKVLNIKCNQADIR
jgi:hypothetical protein